MSPTLPANGRNGVQKPPMSLLYVPCGGRGKVRGVLMLLESGHQSSGHIRQIGLEEIWHTAHGVLQQATALLHLEHMTRPKGNLVEGVRTRRAFLYRNSTHPIQVLPFLSGFTMHQKRGPRWYKRWLVGALLTIVNRCIASRAPYLWD